MAHLNLDDTAEIPLIRVLPDASASAARSLQRAAKDLVHAGQAFLEVLDEFLDDDELVDETVAKVAQWIDRTVLRAEPWVGRPDRDAGGDDDGGLVDISDDAGRAPGARTARNATRGATTGGRAASARSQTDHGRVRRIVIE